MYLHVFTWPADGVLRVAGVKNEARAAYPLLDPSGKLKIGRDNDVITIAAPTAGRDENDTVCVATSATIVDQRDPDAGRRFAHRLCRPMLRRTVCRCARLSPCVIRTKSPHSRP